MTAFIPLMFLLITYFIFSAFLSILRKRAGEEKKPETPPVKPVDANPAATSQPLEVEEAILPPREAPAPRMSEVHSHVETGSLQVDSMEGYDPCHEEQLEGMPSSLNEPLLALEDESDASPSGFSLRWTGDDLVRGFVMSEVLNRKPARR